MKKIKPRVWMYIEGGVLHEVVADSPVDIMVLDCDVDGLDGDRIKTYKDMSGEEFDALDLRFKVDINKKVVDHYFKQGKK
jgi:hypothetical protein